MIIAKSLTTKEVARLCRVSDATVKRWEDAGLLKSERTSGGHRRFRAEEVARFQREQNLGLKLSHGDESAVRAANRRRANKNHSHSSFFHSLVAGVEEEAACEVVGAHLQGLQLTDIFDRLICPAMSRVGELWYKGELTVSEEHLASQTARGANYKLRHMLPVPEPRGELAMCCAFESDFHELPTHLAQMTIENEGWEVMNFGANMPLYALAEEVLHHTPAVVCLCATVLTDIERSARDYKEFREKICKSKIPVVLGGRAFLDENVRRRFSAELYAQSFTELAAFVRRIESSNKVLPVY